MTTSMSKERLLNDLKDKEFRRLFYLEHIKTGVPMQIHSLRVRRRLTQDQLAKLTGMDQSRISKLQDPDYEYLPTIRTLQQIADAFDVPLIVRFGSWDELWEWEHNLSPKKLSPDTFNDALPRLERKAKPEYTKAEGTCATHPLFDRPDSILNNLFRYEDKCFKIAPSNFSVSSSEQVNPANVVDLNKSTKKRIPLGNIVYGTSSGYINVTGSQSQMVA